MLFVFFRAADETTGHESYIGTIWLCIYKLVLDLLLVYIYIYCRVISSINMIRSMARSLTPGTCTSWLRGAEPCPVNSLTFSAAPS